MAHRSRRGAVLAPRLGRHRAARGAGRLGGPAVRARRRPRAVAARRSAARRRGPLSAAALRPTPPSPAPWRLVPELWLEGAGTRQAAGRVRDLAARPASRVAGRSSTRRTVSAPRAFDYADRPGRAARRSRRADQRRRDPVLSGGGVSRLSDGARRGSGFAPWRPTPTSSRSRRSWTRSAPCAPARARPARSPGYPVRAVSLADHAAQHRRAAVGRARGTLRRSRRRPRPPLRDGRRVRADARWATSAEVADPRVLNRATEIRRGRRSAFWPSRRTRLPAISKAVPAG